MNKSPFVGNKVMDGDSGFANANPAKAANTGRHFRGQDCALVDEYKVIVRNSGDIRDGPARPASRVRALPGLPTSNWKAASSKRRNCSAMVTNDIMQIIMDVENEKIISSRVVAGNITNPPSGAGVRRI